MPALTIAKWITLKDEKAQVEFVSGSSALENNIYSSSSFVVHHLSVGRLRKNVSRMERIGTLLLFPFVLLKALNIIIKVKPSVVVGMGGAVSGPILLAAFLLRKRNIIFEFNVVPGLTNRYLSYMVNEAVMCFSETKQYLKTKKNTLFPYPIRSEISKVPIKAQADQPIRILVLGGSQGSSLINKVLSDFIMEDEKARFFSFVHQTGERGFESLKKRYAGSENLKVFSFLHNIHEVYQWADIVISRAGMGAVAEITSIGRAGIFVPLSSSADQHQLKNAEVLEKKSAGILIEEKSFTREKLKAVLTEFIDQPQKIRWLSAAARELKLGAVPDSIAGYILK